MHDADKKIPDWTQEQLDEYAFQNGDELPIERQRRLHRLNPNFYPAPIDYGRPWRAILAGSIIGLIGVLLFVVMSACTPLPRDDGAGSLYKIPRYMEQRR